MRSDEIMTNGLPSCRTDVPSLADEEAIRDVIRHERNILLEGGIQVKVVYLGTSYAVHELRVRGASSLGSGLRNVVDSNPLLALIDRIVMRMKSPFLHALKQNAKIGIEVMKGNFSVLSKGKLQRTLGAHARAHRLGNLVDPFVYLRNLAVRRSGMLKFGYRVIPHAIVKERNDRFVSAELKKVVAAGHQELAQQLIEKAVRLDEEIWQKGIFNTDLVFPDNTTVREESVVLRDLGALRDDLDEAEAFIRFEAAAHIEETRKRLREIVPQHLLDFYMQLANEVYTVENLHRCWLKV